MKRSKDDRQVDRANGDRCPTIVCLCGGVHRHKFDEIIVRLLFYLLAALVARFQAPLLKMAKARVVDLEWAFLHLGLTQRHGASGASSHKVPSSWLIGTAFGTMAPDRQSLLVLQYILLCTNHAQSLRQPCSGSIFTPPPRTQTHSEAPAPFSLCVE